MSHMIVKKKKKTFQMLFLQCKMTFDSKDDSSISNPNSDIDDDDIFDDPDTGSSTVSPNVSFANLGLNDWLVDALRTMSIRTPSEIQQACIPPILKGMQFIMYSKLYSRKMHTLGLKDHSCHRIGLDVIGGAKTGSGKTAAFALPILQKLSEDPYGVFALVLTPTRYVTLSIKLSRY